LHSEVSTALIDRSYAVANHQFVRDALDDYFQHNEKTSFSLVSPDAGASKKIHKLAQELNINNIVACMKERDVKTGELLSFKTTAEHLNDKTYFIVDDICDGEGTFAGTAEMLKRLGASKVVLTVSHGIFSKGDQIGYIDAIYTTDSYRKVNEVKCFEIDKYLK
jgi:ribose-phosphate pyrophosphokinase